jgi:hypothetical protein
LPCFAMLHGEYRSKSWKRLSKTEQVVLRGLPTMHISPRCSCRWPAVGLIVLTALTAAGCGGRKLYPVQGEVVFQDGSPLTGGMVIFEPVDKEVKTGARGEIQADGHFRLGTEQDGDGALEGRYKVLVRPARAGKIDERNPPPAAVHPRYQGIDTTPLEFTVTRDKDKNHFTIEVDKP